MPHKSSSIPFSEKKIKQKLKDSTSSIKLNEHPQSVTVLWTVEWLWNGVVKRILTWWFNDFSRVFFSANHKINFFSLKYSTEKNKIYKTWRLKSCQLDRYVKYLTESNHYMVHLIPIAVYLNRNLSFLFVGRISHRTSQCVRHVYLSIVVFTSSFIWLKRHKSLIVTFCLHFVFLNAFLLTLDVCVSVYVCVMHKYKKQSMVSS